jgi:mycothiol synthase
MFAYGNGKYLGFTWAHNLLIDFDYSKSYNGDGKCRISFRRRTKMVDTPIDFRPVDLRSAPSHEYECLAEFKNALNREYYPDDPPIPREEQVQGWKNIPAFEEIQAYAGWNPSGTVILSYCDVGIEHTDNNEHIAYFGLEVLPEYRCQGLGRQMLKMILPFVRGHNRRLMLAWVNNRIPAGGIFMERLGARKGQEGHTNQLRASELDRSLVDRWFEKGKTLDHEFDLGFWDASVPEEHIVEMANLMQELANDQPRDNLEMEDMKFTPQILRDVEKYFFARGDTRWILYLLDRATGKFVGLTEVRWNPNRPHILNQGFTAIDPEYRNKGLGRWIKAVMMRRILAERPEVEFIRTGNANSNAPMLKINTEMGFKPYYSMTIWQVDTTQVENYLANHHHS